MFDRVGRRLMRRENDATPRRLRDVDTVEPRAEPMSEFGKDAGRMRQHEEEALFGPSLTPSVQINGLFPGQVTDATVMSTTYQTITETPRIIPSNAWSAFTSCRRLG